ncbi:MAG: hypothetical protein ACREDR_25505 [Blastocatellia bacterium]
MTSRKMTDAERVAEFRKGKKSAFRQFLVSSSFNFFLALAISRDETGELKFDQELHDLYMALSEKFMKSPGKESMEDELFAVAFPHLSVVR